MYLVEIEKYKHNTFVIKYFLKKHKKNKYRYNLLSGEFKCRPIVMTVINILMDILNRHVAGSFAFIGAHTTNRKGKDLETKNNTKRFRVYRRLVENKIGPKTFTHYQSENGSGYLLINNQLPDVNKAKDNITAMFKREYPELSGLVVTCQNE